MKTFGSGWTGSVYLDTDVILALLKVDDWLASQVDPATLAEPKTSVATAIEVQYVMEDEWNRDRLSTVHDAIVDEGVDLVPLTTDVMDEAGTLRRSYARVNVFDAVHLGTAKYHDEAIVSTDTLYPDIDEVDNLDPRDL